MFKYKKRATDETRINDELSLIRKIVLSKNAKNFKKKSTFFTNIAQTPQLVSCPEGAMQREDCPKGVTTQSAFAPSGGQKSFNSTSSLSCPPGPKGGPSLPQRGPSEVINTPRRGGGQNLIFTRILPKTKFFLNKIYLKNLAKYTNIFSQSRIEPSYWQSQYSGSPEARSFQPVLPRCGTPFSPEAFRQRSGPPLERLKRETKGNSLYKSPLGITLDQSLLRSKQVMQKFHTEYSKQTEIHLITISLASANRIRQWAEKTLPNGKVVGEVINPETVHYKTLKPIKGGLFCERIFGPLKDHECACGKKFNIKNFLIPPKAAASPFLSESQRAERPLQGDKKAPLGIYSVQPELKAKSGSQKRYFCRICDVEYTYSIIRRTQLGYIRLATPTTHVWFVKGIPSYISILLDIKRKHLQNIIYNSATLTLEHSLRGRQFVPNSPKSIFLSWQKIMQQQYPEKYGKTELNVFQPPKVVVAPSDSLSDKKVGPGGQDKEMQSKLSARPFGAVTPSELKAGSRCPEGARAKRDAIYAQRTESFGAPEDQRSPEYMLKVKDQRSFSCPPGPKGARPKGQSKTRNHRAESTRVYNQQVILYKQNKKAFYKGTYDHSSKGNIVFLVAPKDGAPACGLAPTKGNEEKKGHTPLKSSKKIQNKPTEITNSLANGSGGLKTVFNKSYMARLETMFVTQEKVFTMILKGFASRFAFAPKGQRDNRLSSRGTPTLFLPLRGNDARLLDQEAKITRRCPLAKRDEGAFQPGQRGTKKREKVAQRVPSGQRETDPFTQKKGWIRFVQSAAFLVAPRGSSNSEEVELTLSCPPGPKGLKALWGNDEKAISYPFGAADCTNQTRFYNKIYVSKQHDLTFLCFSLLNIINLTDKRKILQKVLNFLPSSISSTFSFYLTNTLFSSQNCLQLYTHSLLKVLTINTKKSVSCGPLYLLCLKSNLINLALYAQRGSSDAPKGRSSIFINPLLGGASGSAVPPASHLEVKTIYSPEGPTNLINTNLTRFLFFSPSLVFQQVLDTCVNKTWLYMPKGTKSMSQKKMYNPNKTLLMSTAVKTAIPEGAKKTKQKTRLFLLLIIFLKNYNLKHFQKQTTKIALMLTLNFRKPEGSPEGLASLSESRAKIGYWQSQWADLRNAPLGIYSQRGPKGEILKKFNNLTNQKKIKLICQFDCCSYYFKQYYYLKRFNTSNQIMTYYYFLTYPKKQIVQKLYKSLISDFTKIMQNSLISVNVKVVENASLLIQGDLQAPFGAKRNYVIVPQRGIGAMHQPLGGPMKRVGSKGACMEGPFGYYLKLTKDYSYFKLSYIKQLLSLKTLTCFSLLPQRGNKPEAISNFKQSLKINQFSLYCPPGPYGLKLYIASLLPSGDEARRSFRPFGGTNKVGCEGPGPLERPMNQIDITRGAGETKNFISNNIYCLSHRELWEQEKDWQDFSYYYYSPSNIFDSLIPLYKNRNYDRALAHNVGVTFQARNKEPGRLNENNKVLYTSGMNIDTAFSGAGLIQKLLNEFSYTELKKIDKQNRVLLFEYNKYVKDLKNVVTGDDSAKKRSEYYKACHIRDVLIRRTKLTRKIFNKLSPTAQTTGPLGPEDPTGSGGKLIDGLNMILTLLPVLPPVLRPVLKMSGQFTISDLNRLYQRIIYRNERLKKFLKDPALSSSFEMKYAQRLVQEAVDNLIQNGKSGVVPEKDARGRLLKSLSDILKGKQGRFRQYLLGKRVDYSGRSVIVVGPRLKLHECGIPKEMALVLYSPFLIKRILNEKLADTYLSAKKLIRKNPLLVSQLLREIMKECPVLLNRAPTLHRLGFQAFQPKLVDGKAILLHPLVCPAFNADFDGDQMAVHVPITFEARAEAWKLMLARNNLLSPATGEPLILPSQDMVLGCYYLTTNCAPLGKISRKYKKGYGMYFPTPQDVLKAYNQQLIHVHAVIWVSIKGYVENGNTLEQPLEMRLPLTNYKLNKYKYKNAKQKTVKYLKYLEIYKKCHNFLNLNSPSAHCAKSSGAINQTMPQRGFQTEMPITECSIIHQIIKTTPGKIVFNIKLKNAMEKRPVLLSKYVTGTGFMKKRLLNTVAQRV